MLRWTESRDPFHDYHALGALGRVYEIAEGIDFEDAQVPVAVLLVDARPTAVLLDAKSARTYAEELEQNRLANRLAPRSAAR